MYTTCLVILVCLTASIPVLNAIYVNSNTTSKHRRHSDRISNPAHWADEGIWSPMLEQWALRSAGIRDSRVLKPTTMTHVYVTNRIGEEDAIVNPNQQHYLHQQRPLGHKLINSGGYSQNGGYTQNNGYQQNREVSETDLYLLAAMEKLVYRMDFMEKRMRRLEQMLYYVMSGSNKVTDPCARNFTRAGANCYHFGVGKELNWKSASARCQSMDSVLVEIETVKENQELIAHIQSDEELKGKDFWTGGLNPGLLWIWSNSARPVITENSAANATNNAMDIKGSGRCLKLSYNPPLRSYAYFGEDCSARHPYLCEKQDKTISNEISRMAKELNFDNELD